MADQELDLKLQEALIKSSQNLQVSMERYNGLLEKVVGKFKDINEQETQINVELEKTSKTLKEKILGKLKDIGTELKDHIMRPFLAIFSVAKILEVGKAMLEHTKRIKDLSFRMGEAGKTTGQLTSAMYGTAKALGVSTDEALDLIEGLRNLRVSTKDMQQMATVTGQFARVTGVSNQEAVTLTGNLMRFGRLGVAETKNVLTQMVNVQRTVGLTATDMADLSDTIVTTTRFLHQFGQSGAQIAKFNTDTVKLAGAFTKVGLSAKEAGDIIQKIIDPGQIEDNALLIAKLGISMQDVVSGTVDVNQMQKGMKNLGMEMKNMTGPAAAALAKAMGQSRTDIIAWGEMPDNVKETGKNMGDMFHEQRSAQDKFQAGMNNIATTMESLLSKLAPTLEKIGGFFEKNSLMIVLGIFAAVLIASVFKFRKTMMSVATDFGKTVGTATTEALVMAQQKASAVASGRAGMAGRGAQAGMMARVQAGPGYAAAKETQAVFQALSQSDIFPKVAKMTENIAEWYHYVALGQKPVSLIGVLTEQNNIKMKDRIGFLSQEALMMKTAYETQRKSKEVVFNDYNNRIAQLKEIQRTGKLTGEQTWELNKLIKDNAKTDMQIRKITEDIAKVNKAEEDRITRVVDRMLPEARKEYAQELRSKQQILQADLARDKALQEDLRVQGEILQRETNILKDKQKGLDLTKQEGIEAYHGILARLKQIGAENNVINQSMAETTEKLKNEETVAKRLAREMEIVGNVGVPSGARATSGIRRVGDFIKSTFHTAVQGADNILTRSKNSIAVILKDVGARLNPANLFRAGAGKAVEQGQNKLIGALGKTVGPLLKVAGIVAMVLTALGVMEPIQKVIGAILKGLQPMIKTLMDALLPVLLDVLSALMPLVALLVNTLLPPLLVVLGYLVKLLGLLIHAIAKLIGVFGGGDIEKMINGIADSVDRASNTLIETGTKYMHQQLITDQQIADMQKNIKDVAHNTAQTAASQGTPGMVTTQNGSVRVMNRPGMSVGGTVESTQVTADNTSTIASNTESQTNILQDINTNIRFLVTAMTGRVAPAGGASSSTPAAQAGLTGAH